MTTPLEDMSVAAHKASVTGAASLVAAFMAGVAPFILQPLFPALCCAIQGAACVMLVLVFVWALASKHHRDSIQCPACKAALWPLFFRKGKFWSAPPTETRCTACGLDLKTGP